MIGRIMAAAAILAGAAPAWGANPPGLPSPDQVDGRGGCVTVTQLQGDHALSDRSVVFRVNVSDFWRLDFAQTCAELTDPEPVIIMTPVGGIGRICKAIDVDVKVSQQGPGSIPVSCIPSAFYKLTPTEVAAIPKKDLP